jgi:diguanylate cyclase (GGDEF)-like protein
MVVHVETTPEAGLNVIGSFNPDLILMDMYMPVCNGEDLCKIIRQYESFTSIPIVFLSSEADVQKQLNAMKIGADDFLTKGIDPEHLITSITTRIQRHRVLSSFMIRDSLTGLLNHTTSKKQLESMITKAQKLNTPLSFAMIDIDHFKKVNDTYGHPTGDKVIKSLSRLLQKRLRKTDSIGRYGGEEFAIVLWNTDAKSAKKILDEIREDFSKIEHLHEGKVFFTTFSSGIAEFPGFVTSADLSNAADRALYVAKKQGRNQVCISQDNDNQK